MVNRRKMLYFAFALFVNAARSCVLLSWMILPALNKSFFLLNSLVVVLH